MVKTPKLLLETCRVCSWPQPSCHGDGQRRRGRSSRRASGHFVPFGHLSPGLPALQLNCPGVRCPQHPVLVADAALGLLSPLGGQALSHGTPGAPGSPRCRLSPSGYGSGTV